MTIGGQGLSFSKILGVSEAALRKCFVCDLVFRNSS